MSDDVTDADLVCMEESCAFQSSAAAHHMRRLIRALRASRAREAEIREAACVAIADALCEDSVAVVKTLTAALADNTPEAT